MITSLPYEVLYYIFLKFLDFFDTVHVKTINNKFKKILDDKFYENFAFRLYGTKFWKLSQERNPRKVLPCKTFFEELRRIETFQYNYIKNNKRRFSNQEFYNFWIVVEPELKKSYVSIIGN
jgi:hypothetical protein